MRIGILTNTYPPNLNGVSIAVQNLQEGLEAKGHQVFIATPQVQGIEYPKNIIPVRAIATKKKISPDLYIPVLYIQKVVDFFKKNGVQVIHTHDIFMGGAEGIVIANKLGVPCIHTFHTFNESYPYLQVPARQKIIRAHIRLVCGGYDHITAPSLKVYKYLAQIGFKTPVTQLLNVPSTKNLNKKKFDAKLAKKFGISDKDFVFTTFCRVATEKSVDIGIIVLHRLIKKYPNIKYMICGQGPEIENLKVLASNLGIGDKVIFTEKYLPTELSSLASLAKVFLFTSHTENLPTNLFEAMVLGLPVLSVNDESVDYLLEEGENGYKGSVDELSILAEELYLNPNKLAELSISAENKGKEFQKKDVISEYIQLYERVIKYHIEGNG